MAWFTKKIECVALIFFPGNVPPRPGDFKYMVEAGVRILQRTDAGDAHWGFAVEHPEWGRASIDAPRDLNAMPEILLEYARGMSQAEKQAARAAGTGVRLRMDGAATHVLRDRKHLLRYMRLLMGDDGVYAIDVLSQIVWTRGMLDDELAHDADVDVSALYTVHCVGDSPQSITWLHTHGLSEVGAYDFDILKPSADLMTLRGEDPIRGIAYALLEGDIGPGTSKSNVIGFPLRFVDVAEFHRKASPQDAAARDAADPDHNRKRVVACDPPKGIFGFGDRIAPSRALSGELPDGLMIQFSNQASDLMAQRARDTYGVLRRLSEELKQFQLPIIAKVGYEIDGAKKPTDREHLWFSVHELGVNDFDATLESSPYSIARMKAGARGRHEVRLMSDWIILTPAGPITPRSLTAYRSFKEALARGPVE